ncbi:MAG: 4-hydroxythreonine-4-phosphate dehydrogenase PdxA [Verrucomicrobiales bacterium]|nr:4-hydroxythreonine-4-phosphate dehydrogenase PdxA [Verrucomicrobiales bacterium]
MAYLERWVSFGGASLKMRRKPKIAITMGDPAGVGPEICLDLLADSAVAEFCTPIVIGDRAVLNKCAAMTGKPSPLHLITEEDLSGCEVPSLVDPGCFSMEGFTPGEISAATGRAAYGFIIKGIELALSGVIDGVSTAPINKEALNLAGVKEPGHTEIFANQSGTEKFCMMMTSEIITCSLVTVHVGYHEVPAMLTVDRIHEVIELTRAAMTRIRGREPKMVVCGLNPHAGEKGLFGNREEEVTILPAMEKARAAGADLVGPLPPDTAFLDWRRAETDAYICMYHDQGLIPLKALAFDEAINVTLGLPIVRTSVDHGTALDIAWQGKANPGSLVEAVRLAARLTEP